ncbi:MAG: aminoacyl--tRNA ligase-related protein, partial [Pseudomonadota bacterium]
SPAVCYHTYSSMKGSKLEQGRTVTAVGKCFRYESSNMIGLERLWDFSMREIVFIGPSEWVVDRRKASIERFSGILEELGVDCTIETANDPFFVQDYATKTYYQLRGDLKFEIRMNVEPERSIAVGSFNLHDNFFGKAFDICCKEKEVDTGCTAFGLERLVFALFCQHGFEPSEWPKLMRP